MLQTIPKWHVKFELVDDLTSCFDRPQVTLTVSAADANNAVMRATDMLRKWFTGECSVKSIATVLDTLYSQVPLTPNLP